GADACASDSRGATSASCANADRETTLETSVMTAALIISVSYARSPGESILLDRRARPYNPHARRTDEATPVRHADRARRRRRHGNGAVGAERGTRRGRESCGGRRAPRALSPRLPPGP